MIFSCALRYAARRPAAQGRGIFLGLPGTCSSARVARLVGRAGLLSYVPGGTCVIQRTGRSAHLYRSLRCAGLHLRQLRSYRELREKTLRLGSRNTATESIPHAPRREEGLPMIFSRR
jgi:hypothetical protein